ncbi:hypothetical protein LAZ67_13000340 [Cordylochernes scorpioides]|uniref:Adult-specific rigid cuticular protein 15.7 n=1 Tax=Cordylochernes scorpioides TaxID=51811 RepID=A0ABY6L2U0_9ARAC|nr:hypothetical protein LAZ67_13000340 [Cordylochernes scorpioides]
MFYQVAVLCTVAALSQAIPMMGGGASSNMRKQDDFGNYAFGYQIVNGYGATNGRQESGDGHGNVVGSYNLADIDGRVRKVNYVADRAHGFRAVINTNEPGTAASLPAAAVMASPYKGSIAGSYGISHAAPIAVAAAPVAVAAAPIGVAGVGLGGLGLGVKGVGLGGIGLAGAGHW